MFIQPHKQTNIWTYRHTNGQTDRWTDKHLDTQIDRHTDKGTDGQMDSNGHSKTDCYFRWTEGKVDEQMNRWPHYTV